MNAQMSGLASWVTGSRFSCARLMPKVTTFFSCCAEASGTAGARLPTARPAAITKTRTVRTLPMDPTSFEDVSRAFGTERGGSLCPGGASLPPRFLPVVLLPRRGDPAGERHEEMVRKRVDIRLVHAPQPAEFLVGFPALAKREAGFGEDLAHPREVCGGKTVDGRGAGRDVYDLTDVHDHVAGVRKRQGRAAGGKIAQAHHHQGARIQDRREGGQPGLVVVLRAKEGQGRVRDVGLEGFCGPRLPLLEE